MRNAGKFVQLLFLAVLVCVFNVAVVRAAGTSAFFDVTGYGAVADGKTLCTQAIQKTVDACHAAGGGTVYLPAGRYLSGAVLLKSNVTLKVEKGPAFEFSNCKDLELRAVKTASPRADEPVVRMEYVRDAFIQGCRACPGTGSFLEPAGKTTGGIVLAGNELTAAGNPFILKDGAEKNAIVEK